MGSTETSLGELEHLVLLAVLRLGDDAYGVTVRDEIEERGGRRVSLGAVYSALRRLEGKGLLRSEVGGSRPVQGGRARKFVHLTPKGLETLRRNQETLVRMARGLGHVIPT